MKMKILLAVCFLAFCIMASAQASGGQITRRTVSKTQTTKRNQIKRKEPEDQSVPKPTLNESYFESEIQKYKDYFANNPEAKIEDYEEFAGVYAKWADEAYGAKKKELFKKAAEVYSMIGEKFPDNYVKAYAAYKRAELINKTDKDMQGRLAKADYQQVVDLLGNKVDRSKSENTLLKYSLHYLMFSSYLDKNIQLAKDYARKILTIDSEYSPAINILNLK